MQQKRYSIGEVSDILGYKPHVIRYYEKEFDLKIPRNKANHRYFTENELFALKQIKELQERGYNNTQIKVIMKSSDVYARQIYAQLEGVAAADHEISSINNKTLKALVESVVKNSKNEIIKELKNELDIINQNINASISSLTKKLEEIMHNIEDSKD